MRDSHTIPPGVVLPYAGPLAKSEGGIGGIAIAEIAATLAQAGWMFCDGASLSIHDYPVLFGVIGNAFGGDKRSFCLPDLRGRFIRGVNSDATGAGRDPDWKSRSSSSTGGNEGNRVGSLQTDAFQGHEHDYTAVSATAPVKTLGPGDSPAYGIDQQTKTTSQVQESDDGDPRVASETRPVNLYLNYIIRYR